MGKCDLPYKTVISFFDEALKDGHPDMIIWTGDNPQHSIWDIKEEEVADNALNVTRLLKERYNYQGQIIPVWGNHGVVPNDNLDVFGDKDAGVRKQLADDWRQFIGENAYDQFIKTGYYSVQFNSELGLKGRAIVLNCMLHDTLNFFLIRDQTDPLGLTQFLEDELKEAENKG